MLCKITSKKANMRTYTFRIISVVSNREENYIILLLKDVYNFNSYKFQIKAK